MISEASTQSNAQVGKTRHNATPTPKEKAETPAVLAKQRTNITSFFFHIMHKPALRLIYIR